jgi:hypothetical protein
MQMFSGFHADTEFNAVEAGGPRMPVKAIVKMKRPCRLPPGKLNWAIKPAARRRRDPQDLRGERKLLIIRKYAVLSLQKHWELGTLC